MAVVTIRSLSAETHRALKLRAARHGRSVAAEVRAVLDQAVRVEGRIRLGSVMAERSRRIGLSNEDIVALDISLRSNQRDM